VPQYLRLKFERNRRGWSQATLGTLSHHSQSEISLFESGDLIPRPDDLERLARALGITPPHVLMKPVAVEDPEERAVAQ
jgi:transcriptional regulator with XRE-family HTH domain